MLDEHMRHLARPAYGHRIACNLPSIRQYPKNANPSLAESCVDIRALEARCTDSGHDVEAMIALFESRVDDLCSQLDTCRSNFQERLQAFRKDIQSSPETTAGVYSSQHRIQLLRMYGKSMTESGELALRELEHGLTRLTSLEGVSLPYKEHHSMESSFTSSTGALNSTESIQDQKTIIPRTPQPQASSTRPLFFAFTVSNVIAS